MTQFSYQGVKKLTISVRRDTVQRPSETWLPVKCWIKIIFIGIGARLIEIVLKRIRRFPEGVSGVERLKRHRVCM